MSVSISIPIYLSSLSNDKLVDHQPLVYFHIHALAFVNMLTSMLFYLANNKKVKYGIVRELKRSWNLSKMPFGE